MPNRSRRFLAASIAAAALLALSPTFATAALSADVASARSAGDRVLWQPQVDNYELLTLTVAGPAGMAVLDFPAGEMPSFSIYDEAGGVVADGLYKWELRVTPRLDAATRRAMEAERESGSRRILDQLRASGELPAATYQSGTFRVIDGALSMPGDAVEGAAGGVRNQTAPVRSITAPATVLTTNDGVIIQSVCVGIDCPNSPSFGDTTTLLMENNTRIKFDDTSNSGSFPNNDWEIEANSNLNGGANYIGFNDCGVSNQGGCANDLVFAVEAGARQNALYVETDGDVGLGTDNPVLDLHIVTGNTPAIRLEQDGSNGFTPQTWDLAGNEANFFIRDVTNGSALPFRIEPGTASNMLYLDSSELVGIGTNSPTNTVHVRRASGDTKMVIEEASGTNAQRNLFELVNNGDVFFRQTNSSTGQFVDVNLIGNEFRINFGTGGGGPELRLTNTGDLLITGTYTPDYVFESDYPLLSLDELGSFIDQNQHLPNVPSDADVKATRQINVVEFQMRLLEKIEELTLYTLQQHDTINTQQASIADQQASIAELQAQIAELKAATNAD